MSTVDTIRGYLARELPQAGDIGNDQSLLETGILDSLAIVKLIAFVEDEFDVELSDDEFDPEHFETVTAIATLVDSKRG